MLPSQHTCASDATDEAGRHHRLLCRAGTHLWAVPLDHVIEVMRALPIKAVAGGPRCVCGLCIIRGAPVPVIDVGLLISDRPTRIERLITVRIGERTVALAAEAVPGIWTVEREKLDQLPPLLRDAAAETVSAVATLDAELLFLLRTANIVPEGFFQRLEAEGTLV